MATENDAGRDKRLVIGLFIGVAAVVLAMGYVGWSWLNPPVSTPTKIDVNQVANQNGRAATETPEYRRLLKEYNTDGAEKARQDNNSFIASISTSNQVVVPPRKKPVPPPPAKHPNNDKQKETKNGKSELSPSQKKALQSILANINKSEDTLRSTAAFTVATPYEEDTTKKQDSASFDDWTSSVMPAVVSARSQSDRMMELASQVVLIPAFTRAPGTIAIGVDSDNSVTPVIGHIGAGPYTGATLKASNAQLAGDGVVIHFTYMSWNDKSYKVDAYALKDDTLMANVASSVSHHYVSRILLPAVAGGISKLGQLYGDANTEILTDGYNTVTSHVGMPDGTAVAGVIAGGAAEQAGSVLKQDAAKISSTQAIVDAGQPVYIQFMSPVTPADEIRKGNRDFQNTVKQTSEVSPSPPPAQAQQPPRPTLAQLRAQNRQRFNSRQYTASTGDYDE